HTGRAQGGRGVDPADARVRVHRADDHRVGLFRQVDVGVEAAFAADEADVLESLDALPDSELAHGAQASVQRKWLSVAEALGQNVTDSDVNPLRLKFGWRCGGASELSAKHGIRVMSEPSAIRASRRARAFPRQ